MAQKFAAFKRLLWLSAYSMKYSAAVTLSLLLAAEITIAATAPLIKNIELEQASEITQANTLYRDGLRLFQEGRNAESFRQAISLLKQAQLLLQESGNGDTEREAICFLTIGRSYSILGDFEQSLAYYIWALEAFQEAESNLGAAGALTYIGQIYRQLGESEKALEHYIRALNLFEIEGMSGGVAMTLDAIGSVYNTLRDYDQALEYYHRSLDLRFLEKDWVGVAASLQNIGTAYYSLREPQQSLEYSEQALQLFRAARDRGGEAATLTGIGKVYYSLGDLDESLKYHSQALRAFQDTGRRHEEAGTFRSLAHVYSYKGDLSSALEQIEAAIVIVEDLRANFTNADLQTSYFSTVQSYYQFKIDLLMQMGQPEAAFETSEAARARGLLELLNESNVDIRQGVNPQLLADEQTLQQQLQTIEARRIALFGADHTPAEANELNRQSDAVLQQLEQKLANIRQVSPAYADLKKPQPLTLAEIQQQVLDPDTVLLQYALGEEQSYLFVVTKSNLTAYPLAGEAVINPIAETFFADLKHSRSNQAIAKEGAPLVQHILPQEALQQMQGKQVLIAADGILHTIPFAALPLPSPNAPAQNGSTLLDAALAPQSEPQAIDYVPLIKQFQLVNIPSATAIHTLRQQVALRTTAPSKQLALLADPIFADDPRLNGSASRECQVANRSLEAVEATPEVDPNLPIELQVALRNTRGSLNPLPCTRYEAEQIVARLPEADQQTVALDFSATQEWINQTALEDYRIVHFATHGIADNTNPGFSGLVLSQFENRNQAVDDYFLSLSDVFNLRLAADLVVLSACETGQGQNTRGEGIIGLTRGFMYAGAERIISSLWKVDDPATAELMEKFYTAMITAGMSPTEALRQAQLAMFEAGKDPYYWAAFTIQGEWRD